MMSYEPYGSLRLEATSLPTPSQLPKPLNSLVEGDEKTCWSRGRLT